MSGPGSGVIDPGEPDVGVLDGVMAEEMAEEIIDSLRRVRHAQETRYRAEHPGEGLRERNAGSPAISSPTPQPRCSPAAASTR